jgi:hypothetical protein
MEADRRQILDVFTPQHQKLTLMQMQTHLENCNGGVKQLGRHGSQLVTCELSVAGKLPFNGIAAGASPGSDAYLRDIKFLEKVQNTKYHVCYLEAIEMP